jgi:hypothetical protein
MIFQDGQEPEYDDRCRQLSGLHLSGLNAGYDDRYIDRTYLIIALKVLIHTPADPATRADVFKPAEPRHQEAHFPNKDHLGADGAQLARNAPSRTIDFAAALPVCCYL